LPSDGERALQEKAIRITPDAHVAEMEKPAPIPAGRPRIRCRRIFRTGGGEPGRGLRQIIQLRESGRIAGLLHDLGKYSEACQHYIASAGAARGPDHSTAGAREVLKVAS
jgi:hypothetical protein